MGRPDDRATGPEAVWFTRCPVPTPLGIAGQLGWLGETFAAAGIEVHSVKDSRDPAIMRSHYDHHLPWSFRQGGSIPPIWSRSRGAETRLLGLNWADEFQAIVTLPDRGIHDAVGLAGRRFGLPRRHDDIGDFQRGSALKGLVSGLEIAGMTPADVVLVDVRNDDAAGLVSVGDPRLFGLRRRLNYFRETEALLKGEIDAFYLKGPQGLVVANFIGAQVVSEFGFHPDPWIRVNAGTPGTFSVHDAFTRDRPDLAVRLVREVLRAGDWAAGDPQRLLQTIAGESTATAEAIRVAHGDRLVQGFRLDLDPAHVAVLDRFVAFLAQWGIIERPFPVADWIDPEPLAQALAGMERRAPHHGSEE